MVGLVLIFAGVGLMSVFTATIASIFVERKIKEGKGLETVREKGHIIICGWNQHTEEVLQALTAYGRLDDTPIVLINELSIDTIDALKLKYDKYNLRFLRGNYVHEDVLSRANIARAAFVLIMADTSGGHPHDRIDERTTLAALTVKSIAPSVKTVAELLDGENKQHLRRANVDEIVIRGEHVGSLLASAIDSPGLPGIFSSMLSTADTDKLWRKEIPSTLVGHTFKEVSQFFREKDSAILIGLLTEKKAMRLADILSDDTSVIDTFIKEKIKASKRDLLYKREGTEFVVNPDDGYLIKEGEFAVLLGKKRP